MKYVVRLDGVDYISKLLPEELSEEDAVKTLINGIENTKSIKLRLENNEIMILGRQAIERAAFFYLDSETNLPQMITQTNVSLSVEQQPEEDESES